MKAKSIFAASLLVAGAAFADNTTVDTEYVVGVLPVSISGNEVILSIPWIESGASVDGVAVTNLIKTAGLATGDHLLWYNPSSGKFDAWVVADDNEDDIKEWKSVSTVTGFGESTIETTAPVLNRGQALILRRDSASEATIYIVGGEGSKVSKVALTVNAGTQALFAPPDVSNVSDLKAYITSHISGMHAGDEVIITPSAKLIYRASEWKYYSTTDNWATFSTNGTPTLVAGNGLIYVNNDKTNAVTITF